MGRLMVVLRIVAPVHDPNRLETRAIGVLEKTAMPPTRTPEPTAMRTCTHEGVRDGAKVPAT